MGRNAGGMTSWFLARDRRPFLRPAIAAALLHPLFWVMLLGTDPKRAFAGFGGLRALEAFAEIGLIAAILPALGWAFASRSVFAVMALGGVFAWVPWAYFVAWVVLMGPAAWTDLSATDRVTGLVLTVQLLLWPLCFALLWRTAMGDGRRRGALPSLPARMAVLLDALRPRRLLARDRRHFTAPALAAALCNPLPWVLHLGSNPQAPFRGFGGWGALDDFAILLLAGAVPALFGWVFANWAVFGLLAWCGILGWGAWLLMMMMWARDLLTEGWADLALADQGMALLLIAQALPYPLAFWLVLRVAMGWDRRE